MFIFEMFLLGLFGVAIYYFCQMAKMSGKSMGKR